MKLSCCLWEQLIWIIKLHVFSKNQQHRRKGYEYSLFRVTRVKQNLCHEEEECFTQNLNKRWEIFVHLHSLLEPSKTNKQTNKQNLSSLAYQTFQALRNMKVVSTCAFNLLIIHRCNNCAPLKVYTAQQWLQRQGRMWSSENTVFEVINFLCLYGWLYTFCLWVRS